MAATENEIAAKLIERLLGDPAFRDRFRRDPPAACRAAGLDGLAEEMRLGAGKAMHTLDLRESRSSLAGVMMAAAMEGMGVYEFSKHVVPHLEDLSGSLGDVLSRVNLPALPGAGSLAAKPATGAPVPAPEQPDTEPVVARSNGAAPPVAPPPAEPEADPVAPELAGAKPAAAADGGGKAAADGAAPKEANTADTADAAPEAAAPELAGVEDAPAGARRSTGDEPLELPGAGARPAPSEGGPEGGGHPAPAAPSAPAAEAPAPAAPAAEPAAPSGPVDPSTLGQDGTGGSANAEAQALLKNPNIVLDDVGVADIKAGKIDPRVVGVLTKLSDDHKIVVSCMCSDHSKFTAGGSISNHAFGRGADIASIDGEIVSPGSALAREVSSALSEIDPAIRPDEIGSPFAINGPGYFTDAAHQNHIHVGFKQAITPDFKLPAELAAGGATQPVAAPAALAAAPAAPQVAAAPPPDPKKQSGLFAAVPEPARVAAAAAEQLDGRQDSNLFLQAVKHPAEQPARVAAAEPAAPAAVDLAGAPTRYPGDDAPKDRIAAWMAAEANERGLPPQLPVMAALVESGLENVNFGDADSLGYFQMRVSVWERDYPGFATDPDKQIDWFLDQAEAVKSQRIARGQPIDDPSQFGEWIADVERPAEQFRGRYQLRLDEAEGLLKTAPAPPAAPAPEAPSAPAAPELAGAVSESAATKALLANANVDLPAAARADLESGAVDPRLVAVMAKLAEDHEIGLSVIKTGHDQFTSGGSVSNHFVGRGIDIATVDGAPVGPGNAAAREVVSAIAELQGDIRPTEVGSPWSIASPEFFTDAGHQDHIHVAFDGEVPAGFEVPAPAAAAPAAVAAAPAAPQLAAAAPPDPDKQSGLFAAVPEPAGVAAAEAKQLDGRQDSNLFLQAVRQPAEQPARVAAAEPAAPAAELADAPAPPALAQGAGPRALAALAEAEKYTGTPYKWGGSTPQTGFDCSGLVQWAYAQAGVKIPRVTHEQILATNGTAVPRAELLPGDLVFFRDPSGYVHHVGISMGGDKFLHAPHTGDVVKVSSLDEPYYKTQFAGGRRFDDAAGAAPAVAAPAVPAAPAPAIDPVAVASAQAAVARDAAEARQHNSSLFKAINAQEARNHALAATGDRALASAGEGGGRRDSALFLEAITAEQAAKAKADAAAAAAPSPPPAAAPAPAAPELAPAGPPPDLSAVPADYPGDDAGQKALARWLAKEAEKAGLPPELPVMAALVESGVRNLDYGDADSVGFFQMRVSIWNQGEYAGYTDNPGLQAKWFVDHALAHKKQQIARGDADFGKDPGTWGEWIADVERPAEQYRGRYQLRLDEARRLLR